MGIEFVRQHGGRRLRSNLDQLPLPDLPFEETDDERPEPDLDFELPRDAWQAIAIENETLAWEDSPQRFIDGSHRGHTVTWLRSPRGQPIAVRLAEIGSIAVRSEDRTLRREFEIVERVVSMVVDPFPWHEVESFANALTQTGLRLLPATPPSDASSGTGFSFDITREQARIRTQYEMEALEELAFCQGLEVLSLVDGRLGRFQQPGLDDADAIGVIKQQRGHYLHEAGWQVLYSLEPGQRTPAFALPSKHLTVISWYLKLDGARGALPNWGLVRVEIPVGHFRRNRCNWRYLNRLAATLFQLRCRRSTYARSAISLEPIVRAEESLKSLFSHEGTLIQRFYQQMGL